MWKFLLGLVLALCLSGCMLPTPPEIQAVKAEEEREKNMTPSEQFKASVEKALGSSNRGTERVVLARYWPETSHLAVRWSINQNLTNGMTKKGARKDLLTLRKVATEFSDSHFVKSASFTGTYEMIAGDGESSEMKVISVEFPGDRLDPDSIRISNVFRGASDIYQHVGFY